MSRVMTIGFEIGDYHGEPDAVGASGTVSSGAARSGSYGMDVSGAVYCGPNGVTYVSGRHYYLRTFVRWTTFGSSSYSQVYVRNAGTDYFGIRVTTSGVVQLWRDVGAGAPVQIGSDGPTLAAGVWHRLDLHFMVDTATTSDYVEARVNGVTFASGTADLGNTLPNTLFIQGAPGSTGAHVDDVAMNDDQGSAENSWPPDGKIIHLFPVSDSAVGTGWQKPGGGTTGLYSSVDNTPPQGIADSTSAANAEKQIRNATSNASTNYDANCQSYEAAGISARDRIVLTRAYVLTGSSSATNTAGAVRLVSNPADASESSFASFDNGVASTYPTNWGHWPTPYTYNPSVTLGTQPVVRVGKRTATTRVALVPQMAVQVEYVPGPPDLNMARQTA